MPRERVGQSSGITRLDVRIPSANSTANDFDLGDNDNRMSVDRRPEICSLGVCSRCRGAAGIHRCPLSVFLEYYCAYFVNTHARARRNMMKHYLIVGGTSGVGAAVLKRLVRQKHAVHQLSRNPEHVSETSLVSSERWDLLEDAFPTQGLPEKLSGLVYCPGSIRLKPINRLREKEFREDFEINLIGAVKAVQGCLSHLQRADQASIILFSTVAVQTGMAYHASIASAKGAVEGLTRSLAAELAPRIRVNAVAPSIVDTPLAERLLNSEEKQKLAADRHPLKRIGSAEDVAASVDWLLHDPWITGQVIAVDGGISSIRLF